MKLDLSTPGILTGMMTALIARCRQRVAAGSRIRAAGITVGKRSRIGKGVVLDDRGGAITIGAGAWIGPNVTILSGDPDLLGTSAHAHNPPVSIGVGATIGDGAIILPGVRIGTGALIGVGAIVTGDVDDSAIVAGAPAQTIGRCREDGSLEFATHLPPTTGCPSSDRSTRPASR